MKKTFIALILLVICSVASTGYSYVCSYSVTTEVSFCQLTPVVYKFRYRTVVPVNYVIPCCDYYPSWWYYPAVPVVYTTPAYTYRPYRAVRVRNYRLW